MSSSAGLIFPNVKQWFGCVWSLRLRMDRLFTVDSIVRICTTATNEEYLLPEEEQYVIPEVARAEMLRAEPIDNIPYSPERQREGIASIRTETLGDPRDKARPAGHSRYKKHLTPWTSTILILPTLTPSSQRNITEQSIHPSRTFRLTNHTRSYLSRQCLPRKRSSSPAQPASKAALSSTPSSPLLTLPPSTSSPSLAKALLHQPSPFPSVLPTSRSSKATFPTPMPSSPLPVNLPRNPYGASSASRHLWAAKKKSRERRSWTLR